MRQTLREMIQEVVKSWAPPPKLSTAEWANRYRYLSSESSALPGKYSTELTPYVTGILDAIDDPSSTEIVCMKSAQVAWTDGVINNFVGRTIDIDPRPIIIMFPKEGAAKEYSQEKLAPMVEATPRLSGKIDITASRKDGNRALFKKFPGGFLKLVGSNSTASVKSTPAPIAIVEEPDDANINVGKQGDSIKLLWERTKTFHRRKRIQGGTPSIKGLSAVEDAFKRSDQRKFFVPCHDCGEYHVLAWENVHWDEDKDSWHEIYGHARPETAFYACPNCGSTWDDPQKLRNIRRGEWRPTAEFRGVVGFHISELYSPFPGSRLRHLAERYLEAKHKLEQGDDTDMIVFVNSALGLPYEYESKAPDVEELEARGESYQELTVPEPALVLTAGVDVQHDRLAVTIWGWGPGEEMWLVYWGELYARTSTTDKRDPVWEELDGLLFTPLRHVRGFHVVVSSISIDCSDGVTADVVYDWVRSRQHRGVMAVKGASTNAIDREIYTSPKRVDYRTRTKASKHGLQVYIVGTHKAKDLLIGERGRISLQGRGPGRMHWYDSVRQDFYEQLTSEVKAPHRSLRGKMVWQLKAGVRNEALDCTVYALHAARAIKLHTMTQAKWDELEERLSQADLFLEAQTPMPEERNTPHRRRLQRGFVKGWMK